MKTACSLYDLSIGQAPYYLGCHLMTSMLLAQLSIVVPSHAIYSRGHVILLSPILGHYNGMIVAAGHIDDVRIS